MFRFENTEEKKLKAVQLKYDNMPDLCYKYRRVSDNTLDAFEKDILYFSAISTFNDPFECAMSLSYEQIREQSYDIVLNKLKTFLIPGFKLNPEDYLTQDTLVNKITKGFIVPLEDQGEIKCLWKMTDDLIRMETIKIGKETSLIGDDIYRVCSFSEANDSLLMWAHYSDNHQGFCLGYNFKEANDDLTELMLPVIYSDDLLEISKYMFPNINNSLIMNAITRKSKAWEYEKEWRIVTLANGSGKSQQQKVPVPKCVYLGARIGEKERNQIIEIASKKNIDIYQLQIESDKFSLYVRK